MYVYLTTRPLKDGGPPRGTCSQYMTEGRYIEKDDYSTLLHESLSLWRYLQVSGCTGFALARLQREVAEEDGSRRGQDSPPSLS